MGKRNGKEKWEMTKKNRRGVKNIFHEGSLIFHHASSKDSTSGTFRCRAFF
jgi:hypothetical protein